MNTASTAIKKIIAEYLDSEPSEINDELRLCDLGLDEVDIEELWFSIEDELELLLLLNSNSLNLLFLHL